MILCSAHILTKRHSDLWWSLLASCNPHSTAVCAPEIKRVTRTTAGFCVSQILFWHTCKKAKTLFVFRWSFRKAELTWKPETCREIDALNACVRCKNRTQEKIFWRTLVPVDFHCMHGHKTTETKRRKSHVRANSDDGIIILWQTFPFMSSQ